MGRINSHLPLKSRETKSRFNQKPKDNKLLSLSQRERTWNESYHSQEKPINGNRKILSFQRTPSTMDTAIVK